MLRMRHLLTAAVLSTAAVMLAACSSSSFNNPFGSNPFSSSSAPEAPSTPLPPPSLRAEDIVGRWGLASYHRDQDRARTEAAARGQCNQPYPIERSASGGVMMLGHDNPARQDMAIKGSYENKTYIGPGPDSRQRRRPRSGVVRRPGADPQMGRSRNRRPLRQHGAGALRRRGYHPGADRARQAPGGAFPAAAEAPPPQ